MSRPALQGGLIGLGGALVALILGWSGVLTPLENLSWKWRVDWFATAPRTPIVQIALDQQSLDWGAKENGLSWPWPRESYGLILDFCQRAGARAVAFDLLFTEPSAYGPEDDRAFAAALGKVPTAGSVALARTATATALPAVIGRNRLQLGGSPPQRVPYAGGAWPIPELAPAFSTIGNVTAMPDPDGIYRRVSLLDRVGDETVPALGLALYLAAQPDAVVTAQSEALRIGDAEVPLDADGSTILRFRGPAMTFPTFSAAALIQSELRLREGGIPSVDPTRLRDAYVIFGLTAPGLYDLRSTPTDGVFPGMEIHATALDNLLTNSLLRDSPPTLNIAFTFVLALLTGLTVRFITRAWHTIALAAVTIPLPLLAGVAAYKGGWWLPVATPTVAVVAALGTGLLVNYAMEGRKRRFIKRAFNQYLHPTVIEQLVEHPERLRLGGERRELTIFFSDLQGFTTLSETLDPEALTTLLNDYLTAMTDIILDAGGTIDKYEGDAIIAFWNAPLDQPDHAERAVRAALACQERLTALRPAYRERVGRDLFMRIGINTGPAIVGNMGSQRRFDYSMLGDAVNLAARLEGVNKEFGTFTLISGATRARLGAAFALKEIGCVGVVGRKEPVHIFEPLPEPDAAAEQLAFKAALDCFSAGEFADAASRFEQLADADRTAAIYAERCRDLSAAPPPVWDGVWRLTNK